MEFRLKDVAITLVSFVDGTTSLYFANGGGMIGGGGHHTVAQATRRFVANAERYLPQMKQTTKYPTPSQGRFRFYVLTTKGIFTAETDEASLVHDRNPLSPLFQKGNDVLTEINKLGLLNRKRTPSP